MRDQVRAFPSITPSHWAADTIATGIMSRARRERLSSCCQLTDSAISEYFLHRLNQAQNLSRAMFRWGKLLQIEIRVIANSMAYERFARRHHRHLLIGERPFREFLSGYLPLNRAKWHTEGRLVVVTSGCRLPPLGQRQAWEIAGPEFAAVSLGSRSLPRLEHNRLIVVQGHDQCRRCIAPAGTPYWMLTWISGNATLLNPSYRPPKTRYRRLMRLPDHATRGEYLLSFVEQPPVAVPPEQSVCSRR